MKFPHGFSLCLDLTQGEVEPYGTGHPSSLSIQGESTIMHKIRYDCGMNMETTYLYSYRRIEQ